MFQRIPISCLTKSAINLARRYEIKMAFALLNKPNSEADVEDLMQEADLDKDGRISFDEFLASKKSQMFYNLKLELGNGN